MSVSSARCRARLASSFEPVDVGLEPAPLGGQLPEAVVDRTEVFDLRPQFLALGQQLGHLARPPAGVEHPVARGFQLAEHLDQRDAIESDREIVEQLGRRRVAQGGQLLDLAQPHGEDVIEGGLVDVREEDFDEMLALTGAVGGRQRQLLAAARPVAADLERAVRTEHVQGAARGFAVRRRKVALPVGREAVERGADKLQEGGLAGLVGPVENVEGLGQPLDFQPAPHAVPVDVDVHDPHDWSSPLSKSTPSAAASHSTASRAKLSASPTAAASVPARCGSAR